ncbi:acetyl-CoA carboxylase [Vibrio gazogenes]|uniref:Biotin carboxyl carrier protein of acetyl-CoA carboxylase n=1 Tax=Vibrio gazogenes DSM 21264 = NBRC 103151 TaxID=1123492 RepID=A0A1M4SMP8_VIBGA|nr:acetyl-CoA carboxylase [Vibrio gazogenes]USP15903.1 biotin carboxyl carrier domain-containing protein [Vibrio gazogenes]SHE33432.1 biotin carboxyl carrier protein [Vibrio gazogenes DSM 21264] [Vibrio gazogenes DSM 21264 = NBRC 103151]
MTSTHQIISPLPGIFYRRPAPDVAEFVAEGSEVHRGEVIGLIEVMKQFSEVTADVDGILRSFYIENEDFIEPGQVIASIESPK